jgi:hypothetical protein
MRSQFSGKRIGSIAVKFIIRISILILLNTAPMREAKDVLYIATIVKASGTIADKV